MNPLAWRAFFKEAAALSLPVKPEDAPALPDEVEAMGTEKLQKKVQEQKVEDRKDALRKFDKARPYAHRGFVGAIPGGFMAGFLKKDPSPRHRLAGMAVAGGISVGDKYLEDLSKKRGYKSVLKSYQEPLNKSAASPVMGSTDGRQNGAGGLPRPSFPTEGSKSLQVSTLRKKNTAFSSAPIGPTALQQTPRV
jgi:hypothetical protein